ncbi:MAG: hypothetical protein IJW50_09765 [Clostridia bacterium]|nr:hypothetical protein [Clostridia bacterium]
MPDLSSRLPCGIAAGVCSKQDSSKEGAEKFIRAIRNLNESMQIPDKISGINEYDIPKMAKYAEKEANPLYPVPKLMTRRELEKIYHLIGDKYEKH